MPCKQLLGEQGCSRHTKGQGPQSHGQPISQGAAAWSQVHDAICLQLGVAPPEGSRRATHPTAPRGQAPVGEPPALLHLLRVDGGEGRR